MKLLVSALFVIGLYGRASSLSEPEIVFLDSSITCSGGTFTFQLFFDEPTAFLSWILADMQENICSTGSETLSDSGILYDIPIEEVDSGEHYMFSVMLFGGTILTEYVALLVIPQNNPSASLVQTVLEEGSVAFDINIDIGESDTGAFIFTLTTTENGDIVYLDEGSLLPWDNLSYSIPLLPSGEYLMEISLSNGCNTFLFYYTFTVTPLVSIEESILPTQKENASYDILGHTIRSPHSLPCGVYLYPHTHHTKRMKLR